MRRAALVVAAALLAALLPAAPSLGEPDLTPARVAGTSRIETAALLAETGFGRADAAVVASAADFPDALAGAGVAGALGGPVLLTDPDRLPDATRAALARLGVTRVVVLGGEGAVSARVHDELAAGHEVSRVAGTSRYATAARAAAIAGAGLLGGRSTVFVASGLRFPDALAAGGPAFAGPHAVLLTGPELLPPVTAEALRDLAPQRAVVLGGPAAVAERVLDEIRDLGVEAVRVAGPTRTATAAALATFVAEQGRPAGGGAVLVRGDAFADALAAGPFAARGGSALLLSRSRAELGPDAAAWLAQRCGRAGAVQVVGGLAAVGDAVRAAALRAARVCEEGLPVRLRYSVAAEADTGIDPADFAGAVTGVLGDPRGWSSPGLLELQPAAEALHFHVVATARPTAREGDTLRVNAGRWHGASPDERARTVNDLVGHWLGAGGHLTGPWPTAGQRDAATALYVTRLRVAFAGDVHGEGVVGRRLRADENPLSQVAPILSGADLAVVNLETAVGTVGRPADKQYVFRAPPELVTALAAAGVDVVSLANNHALDYGVDGLFETIRLARAAGLAVVGAGRDAAEAYAPAVVDVRGRRVAVVGLSRVLSPGWAAGPGRPGLASAYDESAAVDAVRRAREQADHVVVTIHWGIELADCPDGNQLRLARLLTDAGAEVVAGHHPHVLQGIQIRPNGLVAYSLGNFVWYHRREPSRYTGVLTTSLPAGADAYAFTPAEIDAGGSPVPASGSLAAAIGQRVAERSPGGGRCAF